MALVVAVVAREMVIADSGVATLHDCQLWSLVMLCMAISALWLDFEQDNRSCDCGKQRLHPPLLSHRLTDRLTDRTDGTRVNDGQQQSAVVAIGKFGPGPLSPSSNFHRQATESWNFGPKLCPWITPRLSAKNVNFKLMQNGVRWFMRQVFINACYSLFTNIPKHVKQGHHRFQEYLHCMAICKTNCAKACKKWSSKTVCKKTSMANQIRCWTVGKWKPSTARCTEEIPNQVRASWLYYLEKMKVFNQNLSKRRLFMKRNLRFDVKKNIVI